jgi:hypothetical protein
LENHVLRRYVVASSATVCLAAGAAGFALYDQRSSPTFHGVSIKASPAYQDEKLLERAWNLPAARAFAHRVVPQANPTSCGASSLSNIERSFGSPTSEAAILQGTGKCWFGVCVGGLTLDELATVARASTRHQVSVLRDLSYEQFREHLQRANDPQQRYVVNFHRGPLFGEGQGHFSPLGGFLPDRDLVFVIDVNARYRPFLVDARHLYEATNMVDTSNDKKRGLLALR